MVDVEVKVKMMQGIHMFRRDRTSEVFKCNPWRTKLCPYPSFIWKLKTSLELEWKLGPKSRCQPQTQLQQIHLGQTQPQPAQPSTSPMVRRAPEPKTSDKRKRTMITKRRYNVRVLTHPTPSTPCSTAPHGSYCQHPNTIEKVQCKVYTSDGAME